MRTYIITQVQIKQTFDASNMLFTFHGEEQFHAVIQVTRHPVRTGKVKLLIAAISKPEDSTVLQLTTNNATHCYIFADTFNASTQATNATNNKFNLHTFSRSFVQFLDNRIIYQAIHLSDNVTALACFRQRNFIINKSVDFFTQAKRSHN